MKTFEFYFYRPATTDEKRVNNFGPILEMARIEGNTKSSAVKSAKLHARSNGWRFLEDFTREVLP